MIYNLQIDSYQGSLLEITYFIHFLTAEDQGALMQMSPLINTDWMDSQPKILFEQQ